MEVNEALRQHVTRVGFNLSLTQTQIAVLDYLLQNPEAKDSARAGIRLWVQGMKGLEERGLLHWWPSKPFDVWGHLFPEAASKPAYLGMWWSSQPLHKCFSLTPAGEAVVTLLREAGMLKEPVRVIDRMEV